MDLVPEVRIIVHREGETPVLPVAETSAAVIDEEVAEANATVVDEEVAEASEPTE
jgi:hypothetical protein